MDIEIGGVKPKVEHSAHGRVIDKRSPSQVYENATARASEVTDFIEGLTKVAKPLITNALVTQAKNQVGELLATQDPVELIRSADPDQRALVRSLSPQAQDILKDAAAQGSVRLYQDTLAAEQTKRLAILQSPTASPEEKTKALMDAKGVALEASGIGQMEPSYLVKYADVMAQTDAALQGLNYKATVKAKDANDKTVYINGLRSRLADMSAQRGASAVTGDEKSFVNFVNGLKGAWESSIATDSGRYTPLEQAELWNTAIRGQIADYRSTGDYDEAAYYLQAIKSLGAMGVMTPAGVPFMEQTLSSGYSLKYTISTLEKELAAEGTQWRKQQAVEAVKDSVREALMGDPTARASFQNSIAQLGSAEELLAAGAAFNQADAIGSQPTNEQLRKAAELRYEFAQDGADPAASWQRLQESGLTPKQIFDLAGEIKSGSSGSTKLAAGARSYLVDETRAAGSLIAEAEKVQGDSDATTRITRDLQNATTRATEQVIQERQSKGEVVTADQARDIYRNELEAIRRTRIKEAGGSVSSYSTPARRVANSLAAFDKSLAESKGEVTVMTFPREMRMAWQQANPGAKMTVPALEKFLLTQMKEVKSDGKPVYANPEEMLRRRIQSIQKQNRPPGSPDPTHRYNQLSTTERLLGTHGAEALNWVQQQIRGGSQQPTTPQPAVSPVKPAERPAAKGAQPVGDQSSRRNPLQQVVVAGLNAAANVITPPAAAATLDSQAGKASVMNQETIDTLAKLWGRREPLKVTTPALPQVAAGTRTAPAPLAISSPMHPIFVAIGISEGTRTPNGGFTQAYRGHRDPGDGHWNRGTVSGGRGSNASPEQVDRQWMARLTKQSVSVAPILQRAGLQPGTQGWNRVMFNVLDLTVQAPAAVGDFVRKLPQVARSGYSVEAIAKARADSFINPRTGRLDTSFGSYGALLRDQRSRAGVWDYRRRI